jgi:biotin carboxyl carrier protein
MGWEITIGDEVWMAEVRDLGGGRFEVTLDDERIEVDASFPEPGVLHLIHDGEAFELDVQATPQGRAVTLYGTVYEAAVLDERTRALQALGGFGADAGGDDIISTSMPGKVVAVLVEVGEAVTQGQGIVVVEAMKMENELRAAGDGVVQAVHVESGQAVQGGAPLVTIVPERDG